MSDSTSLYIEYTKHYAAENQIIIRTFAPHKIQHSAIIFVHLLFSLNISVKLILRWIILLWGQTDF